MGPVIVSTTEQKYRESEKIFTVPKRKKYLTYISARLICGYIHFKNLDSSNFQDIRHSCGSVNPAGGPRRANFTLRHHNL
jgi:hypothetical protein